MECGSHHTLGNFPNAFDSIFDTQDLKCFKTILKLVLFLDSRNLGQDN